MLRRTKSILLSLHAAVRRFAAVISTLLFRTQLRRWQKVAAAGPPPWDKRNRLIASFVENHSTVIDVGSGAQTLKQHLGDEVEYQPCDCVKSTPDVIVYDFNIDQSLELEKSYDYVVCSGILEYITNPAGFLKLVTTFGRETLISYNPIQPGDTRFQRMANNWVNHLTRSELEALFNECGLNGTLLNEASNGELLYRIKQQLK